MSSAFLVVYQSSPLPLVPERSTVRFRHFWLTIRHRRIQTNKNIGIPDMARHSHQAELITFPSRTFSALPPEGRAARPGPDQKILPTRVGVKRLSGPQIG